MTRSGRVTAIALLASLAYSAALIVAAFVVPVYGSASSAGQAGLSAATLVGVNGPGVVAVVSVPLLVSLGVAGVLSMRSRRVAVPLAWSLTGLLALVNLLALLSIGIFILPVTAALIIACGSRSGPQAG